MPNNKICVVIPARNETLVCRTALQFLAMAQQPADVEIVVVLDGWDLQPAGKVTQEYADAYKREWEAVQALASSDPRIMVYNLEVSKGVRHALNHALAYTDCTYFIKIDAHCELSYHWDYELRSSYDGAGLQTLIIPRIRSLDPDTFAMGDRFFDYLYIDSDIHQRHWPEYGQRPAAQGQVCEVMSNLGATWFSTVRYWWQIGGHDESLYTWGESAPETSLKCWLGGGRQLLNKNVWFAHMFRRRFPYAISGPAIKQNKARTKEYWLNGEYPLQVQPVEWLVRRFAPVPTWEHIA